jgi:signal transduction histidine kinase
VVFTVGSVVPLAWRRVRPLAAAIAGSALWFIPMEAFLFLGYVVAILLFFALGRWASGWQAGVLGCAWGLAAGSVGTLLGPEDPVPGLFSAWLVVLSPYALGCLMAAQQREADQRILREREATRRKAVEEERARIVRELHDVVGHEVTLMSIQSEAAVQALAHAPERAAEPIEAVRETAHRASRELRAILELLGDSELEVAPDGRGPAALSDRAARLGIPNILTVLGVPWDDAPKHWLALNRIVLECLTNAGKHAPGEEVHVEVIWSEAEVRVRVSNAATAAAHPGSGHGLPGMAERARILGGTLEAGYVDGRFAVSASLPAPAGT